MHHYQSFRRGFTLIEVLIVIALIAILAGILIAVINPGQQFANARNSQRKSHLNTIANGISANIARNNGTFTCAAGAIPATATNMSNTVGEYDIAPCLVPNYISTMPFDPSVSGAHWTSTTDYDSKYSIVRNATTSQITISASGAELGETISIIR
ncbi:MAG: type II secretion system protein [Parcubacteria group bacterium]|nr:type II secretion system protein [Parcubacteria group bacterium]